MEQGRVLATHEDVPDSLRQQLYAAENQQPDQKKTKAADNSTMGSMCPPISIYVLPAVSSQLSLSIRTPANDDMPTRPDCTGSTMVDGLLGVTVEEYTEWQQRR